MKIGCHVSIEKSVAEAPQRAADLGCEVFQIFTRSPQGGPVPEITEKLANDFKRKTKSYKLKAVYVHAPYYINFASLNNRIRYGSAKAIRDELERGSLLGARYVMTHLGTAKDLGEKESVAETIKMLQKTLAGYSGETKLLLENSAGAGKIIGDDFEELAEIIDGAKNEFLAGICLDTQHSFASGYDWRDFEKTSARIEKEIGWEKIQLIHANDSLAECGSRKDRHAHIGEGKIGLSAFQKITAFAEKNNLDMILETEHDKVKEDLESLKKFRASTS